MNFRKACNVYWKEAAKTGILQDKMSHPQFAAKGIHLMIP